jgi:hypothetical protein
MINKSMRASEFLTERVLNLHTPDQKAQYADEVWDMLQKSYAKMGGFKSASSKEELIDIPGYWKVVKRGPELTAVNLYRQTPKTKNFKVYASAAQTTKDLATDKYKATPQGLQDYLMVKKADEKMKRSWAEVSGPAEKLAQSINTKPIPNKFAEYLTGKEILSLNPDGYHYTRLIQGELHEKIIYGFIDLTPEQEKALENKGLDIQDLPR